MTSSQGSLGRPNFYFFSDTKQVDWPWEALFLGRMAWPGSLGRKYFCPVAGTLDPETPGWRSLTQVQPCRYKHPLLGVSLGNFWRKSATHTQFWCVSHSSSALPHWALDNARKISPLPKAASEFLSHSFHHPMCCHCVLTCFTHCELLEPQSVSLCSSVCQYPVHSRLSLNVWGMREWMDSGMSERMHEEMSEWR